MGDRVLVGDCGQRSRYSMMNGLLPLLSSRTSTMPHLPVARRERGPVLDRESCDRCAGCPGCGVTCSRSRACGGGGDRRALGPGSRQGSGGIIRRWICCERTCRAMTFLEHSEKVCAPRARLGVRAIRWAIRQLRFEGAIIAGLARLLATTWNTAWSPIKPCLHASGSSTTSSQPESKRYATS